MLFTFTYKVLKIFSQIIELHELKKTMHMLLFFTNEFSEKDPLKDNNCRYKFGVMNPHWWMNLKQKDNGNDDEYLPHVRDNFHILKQFYPKILWKYFNFWVWIFIQFTEYWHIILTLSNHYEVFIYYENEMSSAVWNPSPSCVGAWNVALLHQKICWIFI